jgi:hypothetical protein
MWRVMFAVGENNTLLHFIALGGRRDANRVIAESFQREPRLASCKQIYRKQNPRRDNRHTTLSTMARKLLRILLDLAKRGLKIHRLT